jgi:flap endonuclease-1
MGVKLSQIIPRREIDFKELENKKIAVDFSNAVYQFLASIRQPDGMPLMDRKGNITSHLMGILTRTTNLMTKKLKICYVFDGKPPELKFKERERRIELKRRAMQSYEEAETDEEKLKFAKRTSRLTSEMISESKELIKALGLPVIQAPSEADAQGSFMCEKKDVWAFATSDTDPLLFGCPRTIPNLTLSTRRKLPSGSYIMFKPELIELKKVLKDLNLNQDQLIVIAILCGTDYNPGGIKRVGQKTALKLVHQYKDFDKLFEQFKPDFNWKQIYAIFKSMPIMKNYQLKWNEIDEEKVKKILVDKHDFAEERVNSMIQRVTQREKSQQGLNKWAK